MNFPETNDSVADIDKGEIDNEIDGGAALPFFVKKVVRYTETNGRELFELTDGGVKLTYRTLDQKAAEAMIYALTDALTFLHI